MIVKSFGCTAIHNKALYKCIIHSFIWHSFEFIFIEFKCEYVYERLYYCTLIKENHNAEKAFAVTTFGFEIKIMDKCCVCGKPPQIRSGLQTHPVRKQNESVLLLHRIHILYTQLRTADGV